MHQGRSVTWNMLSEIRITTSASHRGPAMLFVAFLQEQGLSHQMAKSYLSAVRHMQISQGMGDPNMGSMPRLELVVRGMKKEQAGRPKKVRLRLPHQS